MHCAQFLMGYKTNTSSMTYIPVLLRSMSVSTDVAVNRIPSATNVAGLVSTVTLEM